MATNAPRVYNEVTPVTARDDVEGAAREGYLDAAADRRFSRDYEVQTAKWQRNYEMGRFWVTSMRAAGLTPPEWKEGQSRPVGFDQALATMTRVVGNIVPRAEHHMMPDPDLKFGVDLHRSMRLPHRRRRRRS